MQSFGGQMKSLVILDSCPLPFNEQTFIYPDEDEDIPCATSADVSGCFPFRRRQAVGDHGEGGSFLVRQPSASVEDILESTRLPLKHDMMEPTSTRSNNAGSWPIVQAAPRRMHAGQIMQLDVLYPSQYCHTHCDMASSDLQPHTVEKINPSKLQLNGEDGVWANCAQLKIGYGYHQAQFRCKSITAKEVPVAPATAISSFEAPLTAIEAAAHLGSSDATLLHQGKADACSPASTVRTNIFQSPCPLQRRSVGFATSALSSVCHHGSGYTEETDDGGDDVIHIHEGSGDAATTGGGGSDAFSSKRQSSASGCSSSAATPTPSWTTQPAVSSTTSAAAITTSGAAAGMAVDEASDAHAATLEPVVGSFEAMELEVSSFGAAVKIQKRTLQQCEDCRMSTSIIDGGAVTSAPSLQEVLPPLPSPALAVAAAADSKTVVQLPDAVAATIGRRRRRLGAAVALAADVQEEIKEVTPYQRQPKRACRMRSLATLREVDMDDLDEDVEMTTVTAISIRVGGGAGAAVGGGAAIGNAGSGSGDDKYDEDYIVGRDDHKDHAGTGRRCYYHSSQNRTTRGSYGSERKVCDECGTDDTPQWRTGPKGRGSLCNACGVRYAKSLGRVRQSGGAAGQKQR